MPATLPIDAILPDIISHLAASPTVVIVAEPGAGKSTRVPPALASQVAGQTLLLQPRRAAARAVAQRIAHEQQCAVGAAVGYQIRFENRTSSATRIVVMTEGILARRIQSDPFLDGVGAIILDEFHERSLHTDIALALLREIQSAVRPDLHIVVMSATLDAAPVSSFLGSARIFQVKGRTWPLTIRHAPRYDPHPLEQRMIEAITAAAVPSSSSAPSPTAPHILAFLPGMGEIRRVAGALPQSLMADVHLLHSSVSPADQQAALDPGPRRKIILATNIAETSLTIDGVGTVIDSGLARVPVHDNRLGFDRLETRRISKASAMQRAGRAGRSQAGTCLRLFTAEEYAAMADFEAPEIQRLDLAATVLTLKAYGKGRVEDFQWFQDPPPDAVQRAVDLMNMLGALDADGALTPWGKSLAGLPLHPRLGSVFLHGVATGYAEDVAWMCALLEAGDVSPAAGVRGQSHDNDALDRLGELLRDRAGAPWPIKNAAAQLRRLASQVRGIPHAPRVDRDTALRQALLRGYPDRVARRRAPGDIRGLMVGRRGVRLAAQSRVAGAELFVALDTREIDGASETLVHSASSIDAAWLPELFPALCRDEETIRMAGGKALGVRKQMFADLVLSEKDLGRLPAGFDAGAALQAQLLEQHGSALRCFLANDDAARWIARYTFLQAHMPGAQLSGIDFTATLAAVCSGCRSIADIQRNLLPVLVGMAPAGATRLLADHAPEHLLLPAGTRARINYPPVNTDTGAVNPAGVPSVAARVQELFGMAESPRLAGGTIAVLVELLSPARRPVQITRDLKSFWNTTYQEVRKELRARYPKNAWPEDPWTAPPVSVGRKRR